MNTEQRAHLETLMQRMAQGDFAALITLQTEFASSLRATVNHILRDLHRTDVQTDRDEMDGLVQTAALVIFDHAAGWQPDGALPWTWAYRAIRAAVVRAVGHPVGGSQEDLESEANAAGPVAGSADLGLEELHALAPQVPEVALLLELLHEHLPERQANVFLDYQLLLRDGCTASSHTVASMYDTSPDNVRQIKRRSLKKLQPALATPRYAPLADLPLLIA